jgi:glycolate oxidase FAD binding subunit
VRAPVTLEHLRAIVGSESARPGFADDAVDGVTPGFVVTPGSTEQTAQVLKLANEAGLAVTPVGGATKLDWGNIPSRLDLLLSTARMNRVLEHASGDLVVRVQAGARLADVQHTVGQAGQRLSLDPLEAGATIGGIIATNTTGPLRFRYGAVRDLLIGVTYILADGTTAQAGGRVVKNVAGYDLCKLFSGSFGTLVFIAEAFFRLHPLPAARLAVGVKGGGAHTELHGPIDAILRSNLVPSALNFLAGRGWSVMALFEGVQPGVEAQARATVELWKEFGEAAIYYADEYSDQWERATTATIERDEPNESVLLKISTVPTDLGQTVTDVMSSKPRQLGWKIQGYAGSGIVLVDLLGDSASLVATIDEIRSRVGKRGGTVVVRRASPAIKREVDVWGPVGDALPLMRSVKQRFDPLSTMNPGRFVGGI